MSRACDHGVRHRGTRALATAALLLAIVALLLSYGGHALLRSQPFADRAATRRDPAVQDDLADHVTDAVVGRVEDLAALAALVNDRTALLRRLVECRRLRHRLPNLVAVDFYGRGDVLGVVDTLNGVTRTDGSARGTHIPRTEPAHGCNSAAQTSDLHRIVQRPKPRHGPVSHRQNPRGRGPCDPSTARGGASVGG
jgi:hypothetical protein